jgi:hypothetical protein
VKSNITKNTSSPFANVALLLVLITFIGFRIQYWSNNDQNGYNATSWDAFGYYMYLPSIFIYDDVKQLKWIDKIDAKYNVTGGNLYQAGKVKDKKTYTNKYLSGVACLQLPYFLIAHGIAHLTDYEKDGFSEPYQYTLLFGAISNVFIGLWILKKVLQRYFTDKTIGLTLLFLGLTNNLIQYTSIDGAMSHAFIFPLYSILLWLTIKWHDNPKKTTALLIGAVIGAATISRPTELIMIFIPLLWNTENSVTRKAKWQLVKRYRWHVLFALLGGLIAMLPQFIYWKYTTDSFIYNVGSKWFFLNPWFRVLVGPEKGWFLYTPVAIMMILGLFFIRKMEFKRSALVFIVLNIWIVIAWSDWTYGSSYSTRALVQSYPVFALPLAAFIAKVSIKNWSTSMLIVLLMLLTWLNFYQINVYNKGILEGFSPLL